MCSTASPTNGDGLRFMPATRQSRSETGGKLTAYTYLPNQGPDQMHSCPLFPHKKIPYGWFPAVPPHSLLRSDPAGHCRKCMPSSQACPHKWGAVDRRETSRWPTAEADAMRKTCVPADGGQPCIQDLACSWSTEATERHPSKLTLVELS